MSKKIELSIIIPAYNEEYRISDFLDKLINYSITNLKNYEIIIVDDGSEDNTKDIVSNLIKDYKTIKLISYYENRGKGYAILQGINNSAGDFILFMDADGSTAPEEILKMLKIHENYNYDIIIGTRIAEESNITIPQPISRKLLSKFFNLYSNLLFKLKIHDLLCGFKGFKRNAALQIFKDLKSYRWEFDVEILYKARKKSFSIYQVPIRWKHREGSKIKKSDPIFIFLNLFKLRLKLLRKV
ncbi:MAG: glycosyltransferase family 2 protein [Promethearchaeota archaeon]|nr:MAG: glycosyltransferase family 2 protein [Candidatus Lokiarchaeota archaeon]